MKNLSKKLLPIINTGLDKVLYKNIKFKNRLGKGSTASVYKCLINGSFYAVKIFDLCDFYGVDDLIESVYNECFINDKIANLDNFNHIKMYSVYNRLEDVKIYLISEYYDNSMDLRSFLNKSFINGSWTVSLDERLKIIGLLIKAVSDLHNINVIHCDLKLENIIIYKKEDNYCIQIIDYGVCCYLENYDFYDSSEYDYHFGTIGYMPSEVYYQKKMTYNSDVYSLLICILELIVGKIWHNIENETFKTCLDDIKSSIKKISHKKVFDYFDCKIFRDNLNTLNLSDIKPILHHLQLVED